MSVQYNVGKHHLLFKVKLFLQLALAEQLIYDRYQLIIVADVQLVGLLHQAIVHLPYNI